MGTGKLSQSEEQGLGLAGEHDYAILELKEQGSQQLLLVKNPWSEGTAWKGHLCYDNNNQYPKGTQNMIDQTRKHAQAQPLSSGTFWMGLNDVFQSFESMYLNWNPALFSCKESFHFVWDITEKSALEGSCASNPQFSLNSAGPGTVWILLSRHFASRDGGLEPNQQSQMSLNDAELGFISLSLFSENGKRVLSTDGATLAGPYVDSPNTLLKMHFPAATNCTIVVSEEALPRKIHAFTLSSLSWSPCSLAPALEKYSHVMLQDGAWTQSTAGGNAGSDSYYANPQFSVKFSTASSISMLIETSTQGLPVHVKLVWASGRRIHSITTRDVVGDSGEYRKGFALAEISNVQAGAYTIICSTFGKGQTGNFSLQVRSTSACQLNQLPAPAAGRFVCQVRTAIFPPTADLLVASLISQRINRLSISARSRAIIEMKHRAVPSPLKITLERGRGPFKQILPASADEDFVDTTRSEARVGDFDIQPSMLNVGGLWICLERLAYPGLERDESVEVEIISDQPINVGDWKIEER